MMTEEIRLECLRLASRLDLPPDRIVDAACRYVSFIDGYRFTPSRDRESFHPER